MPQVEFHTGVVEPMLFACRLLRKAYRQGARVAVTVSPEQWKAHGQALGLKVQKAVQEGLGLTVDDVVPLAPGALPKTSSGKLQRRKTAEMFADGALGKNSGPASKLGLLKHLAASRWSFIKASFGRNGE